MKRTIVLIVVLMSICVTGIIGLQLFWNYQSYKNTLQFFDHSVNDALVKAVAKESFKRKQDIVKQFENWLADTSVVTITADHNNRDSATVFHIQDTHPKFVEDLHRQTQFGLSDFKERLNHITPAAKKIVIKHFAGRILMQDLEKGIVYNYTQTLGDSLKKAFYASRPSLHLINQYFKAELLKKNIKADFVLNPGKQTSLYLTNKVNADFRKPYQSVLIYAGIEHPDNYFFKAMKWVIITSLLLISITIGCFYYTVKTLFSQHKLSELKDNFVSNMTHELNTPIASIKITAEALKKFKHDSETREEYLNIISYQADRLSNLTDQILNTAERVNSTNSFELLNLYDVIQSAIGDIEPVLKDTNSNLDFKASISDVEVYGDRGMLSNALVNLIDNALKYTNGRPIITISLNCIDNIAFISIADNGIGIPSIYKDQIFDRFFRIPNGNLHNVKGFGLGLSYVKQIVTKHKGFIDFRKNDPEGSIFTIKLPIYHG